MTRYLGQRVFRLVLVFFLATLGTMLLTDLTPGDPAVQIAGETASEEQLQAVREKHNLDDPIHIRWWEWTTGVLTGDFGESHISRQPIATLIKQRLPITLQLTAMAAVMSVVLVVPLALLAAYRQGSWFDRFVNTMSATMIAVPGFVLGLVLVLIVGIKLNWFPVSLWVPLTEDPLENLRHAILPASTLAIGETAIMLPVLRADVTATLEQDYITLARAKGISSFRILVRHALRPSSISLVTLMGLAMARLFGGTVIIETIFGLQGIGGLLVTSIRGKDLIVTQGLVMFIAVVYITANLVVDLLYSRLDPRVAVE